MKNQELEQENLESPLTEENPPHQEVKDDVVIIGGKERPLKNFISEIQRKTEESVLQKLRGEQDNYHRPEEPKPVSYDSKDNYLSKIVQDAEDEMVRTGRTVPIETIIGLITSGSQYHVNNTVTVLKNSEKAIKTAKKSLREQHKDYKEYEDEFDTILENIDPKLVNVQSLERLFNSIRGERIGKTLIKQEEDRKKKIEKEEEIVGPSKGSGLSKPKKETLTSTQIEEMIDLGFDEEDDYLERLKKRQERAKIEKWKTIPQTLGEKSQKG